MASGVVERVKARPSDALLVVLSVLLLVAFGLAYLYHLRYSKVDDSVMPGKVELVCNDRSVVTLDITSMDDATIEFDGLVVHGKLRINGMDTQSILYSLNDASYENGLNPEDFALLLRVPRGGLQGDLSGPWMVYFAQIEGDAKHSMWALLEQGGRAHYGTSRSDNPMTMLYPELKKVSKAGTWKRDGSRIMVTVPKKQV
ncbi:MAG: hypothetical protein IKG22_04815 [Atopobiaceae bacterium]|nr:hypothetical protein [Atopobiaceae bacterium]